MSDRPSAKETLSAAFLLLVVFGAVGAFIWFLYSKRDAVVTPKHVCPYCGQEIKVELEKNGEKKP